MNKVVDIIARIKMNANELEKEVGNGFQEKIGIIIKMCDDIACRKNITEEVEQHMAESDV